MARLSKEKTRNIAETVLGIFLLVFFIPWLMLIVHVAEKIVRSSGDS